jgi:hypothetical protein
MAEREASVAPAPHHVQLEDGWALWRTVCLRGTGFAVDLLETIAAPEAAAAVDHLLHCEKAEAAARWRAIDFCNAGRMKSKAGARKPWRQAEARLRKGVVPATLAEAPESAAPFAEFGRAMADLAAARREAEARLVEADAGTSAALRETAGDGRFREALTWQNRQAVHNALDPLLSMAAKVRNKKRRHAERLVASYLQRYCAKNDSIGFFGPVGWGGIVDQGPALTVRPGPGLVASRHNHFEFWAIDALARSLAATPGLRPWLAPRLNPLLRVEGGALCHPSGKRAPLPPAIVRLLAACDGESSARAIAADLVDDTGVDFRSPEQVFQTLDEAAGSGVVIWTLDVPVGAHPERALRARLERVGDTPLRARLSAPLDALEAGREAVAASSDPASLDVAMGALEARFTELTGTSAVQRSGRTYAGRTLVYQDCRRDAEVELGPELVACLSAPLALILESARWYSHSLATGFRRQWERLYADLRARSDEPAVEFYHFWRHFRHEQEANAALVQSSTREFQKRWAPILSLPPGASRVALEAAAIRGAVAEAFAAPHPGWSVARFHSPDLMIAGESVEQIRRGRFQTVLGELHACSNTLAQPVFLALHPRPDEIVRALGHDRPRPRIVRTVISSHVGARVAPDSLMPGDLHLLRDKTPSWRPPEEQVALGALVVEKDDGRLVVRTRDGARRFEIDDFFSMLHGGVASGFGILPPRPHTPRVAIDDLVISRETWRFARRELEFARLDGAHERFVAVRRWAREQGLPRWLFVSDPTETKPIYLDLESPLSVDLMVKMVRAGGEPKRQSLIAFAEMLPTPDQAWLSDSDGTRYLSELRVVAVDPEPWRPSEA